ncbi:MAG: hypothetical protein U0795_25805 [Pirellulales bacterium]
MRAKDLLWGRLGAGWRWKERGAWVLALAMGLGWGAAAGLYFSAPAKPVFLPEIPLGASSSVISERFSIATGSVDDEVEGLFVLDSITGELQCHVMNVRTAKFGGKFRRSVLNDLGVVPRKDAQLALVTGYAHFARSGRVSRVSNSVVYVIDPSTGTYVAYALAWRPEMANAGREQGGTLELLDRGQLSIPVTTPAAITP